MPQDNGNSSTFNALDVKTLGTAILATGVIALGYSFVRKRGAKCCNTAHMLDAPINKTIPYNLINQSISNVPTPSLIIDLDILEQNIAKMNKSMQVFPNVKIRPHYKANKCPQLAHKQLKEHGSRMSGICCQKLSEAESLLCDHQHPVSDIFISNEVVEPYKLERIVKTVYSREEINLSLTVDNASVVKQLAQICAVQTSGGKPNKKIQLIVEYNVGQNRCGVNSIQELIDLAKLIRDDKECSQYLQFVGIQCYQGWNQHVRSFDDRRKAVAIVNNLALEAKNALEQEGFSNLIVTGGGTGSYPFEAESGVFTEVQPGSYVFMDADYNRNCSSSGNTVDQESDSEFAQSLFVLATVVSKASNNARAVIDAGMKAVSLDSGVPVMADANLKRQIEYKPGGDEHGILQPLTTSPNEVLSPSPIQSLSVGDKMKLIPGHCDPTVNLHDWFICVRKDVVVDVWPITGRSSGL